VKKHQFLLTKFTLLLFVFVSSTLVFSTPMFMEPVPILPNEPELTYEELYSHYARWFAVYPFPFIPSSLKFDAIFAT
jgi:hypothetical protein